MAEEMFINARNPEELRIAIRKDRLLNDVIIEHPGQERKQGNIYLAVVTHCEESLNAIFVRYVADGSARDGFLPKSEILPEYFNNSESRSFDDLSVKDIPEGRSFLIQVDKEERGTKGAALTTYISLAGSYLVLMPNNPKAGGISRRIEGEDRNELREVLAQLHIPDEGGVIIRTAGVGKNVDELQRDLDVLIRLWDAIKKSAQTRNGPCLIHQESDAIGRAIRDYLRQDITEIQVDTQEAWEKACYYVNQLKPDFVHHVKLYTDLIPLFNRYHIESQIEAAFQRQVKLPSGGNIVIDHTEALVSIDVNSAKATRGTDIEDTALQTNIEAAREIARQLRIRDLSGIIVIDFIDMSSIGNQREVENILREEVKNDRARIQIGRISRFGILEMSRQRLRPSLREASSVICPRCNGHGRIRAIESLALAVLRLLREEAMNKKTEQIEAQLPIPVGTYLLNEKRSEIYEIEQSYTVKIILIPNEHLETPHYVIRSYSQDDLRDRQPRASYRLAYRPEQSFEEEPHSVAMIRTEPAIKTVKPTLVPQPKGKPGILKRIFGSILGEGSATGDANRESVIPERSLPTTPTHSETTSESTRPGRREGNYGQRSHGHHARRTDEGAQSWHRENKSTASSEGQESYHGQQHHGKRNRRNTRRQRPQHQHNPNQNVNRYPSHTTNIPESESAPADRHRTTVQSETQPIAPSIPREISATMAPTSDQKTRFDQSTATPPVPTTRPKFEQTEHREQREPVAPEQAEYREQISRQENMPPAEDASMDHGDVETVTTESNRTSEYDDRKRNRRYLRSHGYHRRRHHSRSQSTPNSGHEEETVVEHESRDDEDNR